MSLNVSSVNYAYAAGPIGFEAIGASAEISANSSLRGIYEAYADVFGKYNAMHTTLLGQLDTVLKLLGNTHNVSFNDEGELDLSKIFDENELRNNIGIKSAPKGDERKGGFVSSLSTVFTESEDPLHRESAISSNGSRVAEVLSQKDDIPFSKDSEQLLGGKDVVLPQVQPKVAVNTYERVQQDRLETVQGMIATLEQQMDEMKRARRNSVIVKVDLENGESLNCQVTLTRSDVAIRFPALEESFKMQLLNHWESLRKFAQTRQLNLEEPHFIAQTSL